MKYKSPRIHQTPLYRANAAYRNMKRRCAGGNAQDENLSYAGVELKMTMEQWITWALPQYVSFIGQPSVSRIGDVGHYEIGNVEIISVQENRNRMKMIGRLSGGIKRCSRCKEKKTADCFGRRSNSFDGLNHNCKECVRWYAKINRADSDRR